MSILFEAYDRLWERFGPQGWWPADSPFEVAVGAILTQNTAWRNVELALDNLREAEVLSVDAMYAIRQSELAGLIRPAGYYRLKARRLKNFVGFVMEQFQGSMESLITEEAGELKRKLLTVHGIGPETADSIMLYAARKPVFVVDAYTARVLQRHGWIHFGADYNALQELFHQGLEQDPELFNEYHALIVRVGKEFCRKSPQCEECPLISLLPEQGPLQE